MPPFCQIGKGLSAHPPDDQPSLLADSASLSLFPHRLLYPSSPLNYKRMLAHSRTTTEQRSRMDALELGNDSGSLLACRNRQHSPEARGGLRGWTQHLGLDQQGLEAALDSKEDSRRGRARQEIEQSFSHPPPRPPHWQQVFTLDSLDLESKLQQQMTMLATHGLTTNGWSSLWKLTAHQDGSIRRRVLPLGSNFDNETSTG